MSAEHIRPLKLSENPATTEQVVSQAPAIIESFLDQLDGDEELEVLKSIVDGTSLEAMHGEVAGRELAAYRLTSLLTIIGEAAAKLSDIDVIDYSGEHVTETNTLTALTSAAVANV